MFHISVFANLAKFFHRKWFQSDRLAHGLHLYLAQCSCDCVDQDILLYKITKKRTKLPLFFCLYFIHRQFPLLFPFLCTKCWRIFKWFVMWRLCNDSLWFTQQCTPWQWHQYLFRVRNLWFSVWDRSYCSHHRTQQRAALLRNQTTGFSSHTAEN